MGGNGKHNLCDVLSFSNYFYAKYVEIIGLKAPGNYSASFWSNEISVILCEGPKPNISMISGFLEPWSPVFMAFIIPKILQRKFEKIWEHLKFLHIWT